jgi:hypothetical protein
MYVKTNTYSWTYICRVSNKSYFCAEYFAHMDVVFIMVVTIIHKSICNFALVWEEELCMLNCSY